MIPGNTSSQRADRHQRGRPTRRLEVANTGDRPVQVAPTSISSRSIAAWPSTRRGVRHALEHRVGDGRRFEPGDTREVELVAIGGSREVIA